MWGNSWRVARIMGIDVRLDPSWFLVAALVTWALSTGYFPMLLPNSGAARTVGAALAAMLGLFGSLLVHEFAHALVARRYGLQIRSITLFLFGGVAELAAEPSSASVESRVALAGPLASLGLSGAAYAGSVLAAAWGGGPIPVAILTYLAAANALIAVFNMLPAFPLDGGRVLRAFIWRRSGDQRSATRQATVFSRWIAYGVIALSFVQILSGGGALAIWPALIGFFILIAAQSANTKTDVETALERLSVADVMRTNPFVTGPWADLQDVVDNVMLRHGLSYVPVVEDGRLLGEIDLAIVREIDREFWPNTRVDDVFLSFGAKDLVGPRDDARPLFDRMLRERRRKFPVVAEGRLLGLVTLSDLLARIRISGALADKAH